MGGKHPNIKMFKNLNGVVCVSGESSTLIKVLYNELNIRDYFL